MLSFLICFPIASQETSEQTLTNSPERSTNTLFQNLPDGLRKIISKHTTKLIRKATTPILAENNALKKDNFILLQEITALGLEQDALERNLQQSQTVNTWLGIGAGAGALTAIVFGILYFLK